MVPGHVLWILLGTAAALPLLAVLAGLVSGVSPDGDTLRYFSAGFLARGEQYERVRLALYLVRQALTLAVFAAAAVWSWRRFGPQAALSVPAAAGYIVIFLVLLALLTLPLDFVRGFMVEQRFGFSTQSAGSWLLDYGKSFLISLVISTFAYSGLYMLIVRLPGRWWLPAGALLAFFTLAGTYLYPLLIDPLFYRFRPLEDQVLEGEILTMAEKAGLEVDRVLVADASWRTQKANAYFTGMGGTRRIVIYDTLLHNFSREEVLAVIAHEMGHWRHAHVLKGTLAGIAGGFIVLFLLQWLFSLQGIRSGPAAIFTALLFVSLLSLASLPLQNAVSRIYERQADREALALTGNTEVFITMKQNLAVRNLSRVQPHPLIRWALYTHPSTMERIALAEEYRKNK